MFLFLHLCSLFVLPLIRPILTLPSSLPVTLPLLFCLHLIPVCFPRCPVCHLSPAVTHFGLLPSLVLNHTFSSPSLFKSLLFDSPPSLLFPFALLYILLSFFPPSWVTCDSWSSFFFYFLILPLLSTSLLPRAPPSRPLMSVFMSQDNITSILTRELLSCARWSVGHSSLLTGLGCMAVRFEHFFCTTPSMRVSICILNAFKYAHMRKKALRMQVSTTASSGISGCLSEGWRWWC